MPSKGQGGLGNPFEREFYEGYRDAGAGEPQPKDIVFDPSKVPPKSGETVQPGSPAYFDEMFYRFGQFLKKTPILTKLPSFVQPPFFSKPQIKFGGANVPFVGSPETMIYDRVVEARQKLVITSIGIGVDQTQLYTAHQLLFWFADLTADAVIPVFDDQSAAAAALAGFTFGKTTMLPGSMEEPYSLIRDGCAFVFEGPKRIRLFVQNFGNVNAEVQIITGIYQYWIPFAAEFEAADNQI
jgi:hypothetical protein